MDGLTGTLDFISALLYRGCVKGFLVKWLNLLSITISFTPNPRSWKSFYHGCPTMSFGESGQE
jgi:hypothetical protein